MSVPRLDEAALGGADPAATTGGAAADEESLDDIKLSLQRIENILNAGREILLQDDDDGGGSTGAAPPPGEEEEEQEEYEDPFAHFVEQNPTPAQSPAKAATPAKATSPAAAARSPAKTPAQSPSKPPTHGGAAAARKSKSGSSVPYEIIYEDEASTKRARRSSLVRGGPRHSGQGGAARGKAGRESRVVVRAGGAVEMSDSLPASARAALIGQIKRETGVVPVMEEGVDDDDVPQMTPLDELKERIHRELEEYCRNGPLMLRRGSYKPKSKVNHFRKPRKSGATPAPPAPSTQQRQGRSRPSAGSKLGSTAKPRPAAPPPRKSRLAATAPSPAKATRARKFEDDFPDDAASTPARARPAQPPAGEDPSPQPRTPPAGTKRVPVWQRLYGEASTRQRRLEERRRRQREEEQATNSHQPRINHGSSPSHQRASHSAPRAAPPSASPSPQKAAAAPAAKPAAPALGPRAAPVVTHHVSSRPAPHSAAAGGKTRATAPATRARPVTAAAPGADGQRWGTVQRTGTPTNGKRAGQHGKSGATASGQPLVTPLDLRGLRK